MSCGSRGPAVAFAEVPLRLGKVDFAPVVGVALVFLVAELAGRGLVLLYGKLPF